MDDRSTQMATVQSVTRSACMRHNHIAVVYSRLRAVKHEFQRTELVPVVEVFQCLTSQHSQMPSTQRDVPEKAIVMRHVLYHDAGNKHNKLELLHSMV